MNSAATGNICPECNIYTVIILILIGDGRMNIINSASFQRTHSVEHIVCGIIFIWWMGQILPFELMCKLSQSSGVDIY